MLSFWPVEAEKLDYHTTQFCSTLLTHHLKKKSLACQVSSQIFTFMKLLGIKPNNHPTTASYTAEMRDIVADMNEINIKITEYHVMGLILRLNLTAGPVKEEVARRVEHIMFQDPQHAVPTFKFPIRELGSSCI
ncbi:uncharacterized protein VP01_475g2 [Puccinia sorghi]|uniref:Uncharacterized protein n=1 Tax=Puccinia sorghi TaxID=27349 RepID=A0A0L6UMS2_9BASI|nr:uncharacterized protein VP01_475g2 [Puccinia sorghi]